MSTPRWSIPRSACSPTRRSTIWCPARCRSASAMRIPTSCPTRCFRSPTATSSSRPATTASSPSCAPCWASRSSPSRNKYIDNKARLAHRAELVGRLCGLTARLPREALLDKLEAVGVPAGPINDLDQVFSDPQVVHRGMQLELPSAAAAGGKIPRRAHADHARRRGDGGRAAVAAARRAHRRDFARDRRRVIPIRQQEA